jgi:hypothetical protein
VLTYSTSSAFAYPQRHDRATSKFNLAPTWPTYGLDSAPEWRRSLLYTTPSVHRQHCTTAVCTQLLAAVQRFLQPCIPIILGPVQWIAKGLSHSVQDRQRISDIDGVPVSMMSEGSPSSSVRSSRALLSCCLDEVQRVLCAFLSTYPRAGLR